MTGQITVLGRLRAATTIAHHHLEDRLNAVDRLSTLEGRRALVPCYYRMHHAAEAVAWPWLLPIADLDVEGRSRTGCLLRDLQTLGMEAPGRVPMANPVHSAAEALGLLYVLEGSTLGGRMMRGMLVTRGCDLAGLSFLDPYGSNTGTRWREFLSVLEREAANDPAAAKRGAVGGFRHAESCLVEGVPA